jgi:hypothetical protein
MNEMSKKNEVKLIDAEDKSAMFALLKVSDGFKEKMHIDLTASIEDRWNKARAHSESESANRAAFGLLIQSIKNDLPHGHFLPELERRGFEKRAAQQAMAYAEYVFSQPPQHQDRLLEMPITKVNALAGADPEVVEVLMDDGDTVEQTTVRALVNELKAAKARATTAQANANAKDEIINALQKKKRLSDFSAATQAVRDEAVAQQATADYGLAALKKLWDMTLAEGPNAPEFEQRIGFLWFAVHGHAAQVQALLDQVRETAPACVPEQATTEHALSDDEAEHFALEWSGIKARLALQEGERHDRRQSDLPRDVGRPRKAPLAGSRKG